MSTQLNFGRDVQGNNAYAPYQATDIRSATIAAAAAQSITVPSNAPVWIAAFSYEPGAICWVRVGGTAAGPAGATFAATTSQLLPAQLTVLAGQTISVFNNGGGTAQVSVSLYVSS